jgi:putative flippase GtrA
MKFLEIVKYGQVGIAVYLFDYFVFFILLSISFELYLLANIAGRISGALLGFFLHRKWTFKSDNYLLNRNSQFLIYTILLGFNLIFSSVLLYLAERNIHFLDIRYSRIIIDFIIISSSFLISKLFIFRALSN